ncbi:3-isopropylmalate dehydrogenase [Acidithrix ferrooxidans]|uniref:3-isopropylmalate dehydrogenase n=1 Tax=Acidithrix ferrooxidans TaxID=1280514 RepID=A0A0D8HK03_9ACTN|nr:3-isopropylmalate dehydrogenase [Acidithrix ferrooxidans]KJF18290.1 3-isopropylmalate dehydrogenase [Acidithrix ferrooxidans]
MYNIALIGGDGIGPEVVEQAMKVIDATGVKTSSTSYNLGASRYIRTKEVLPDSVLDELRTFDAILLGAVGPAIGSKEVPSGTLERGLLLKLRFELDLYINLRPFVTPPSGANPAFETVDFVVIRENTEGTYAGEGGFLRKGTPNEVATQGSVNTRFGVERAIRFAFELANSRPAKNLTLVHKTNVLTFSGDLWQRTFDAVALEFLGVSTSYNHVDAACIYMVESPSRYDVIVTDNLFGDILTDLAGAISGGIGHAASANLNPARTGPSLFEPVHGAAHDIVGTGKANPIAAIRSGALMLDFLGESQGANKIFSVLSDFAPESGATTSQIGDAIAERVSNAN